MSKIKTILSIIFYSIYIWGCVSLAYPILLWWSWECVLYLIIIIKPEVWIINHCSMSWAIFAIILLLKYKLLWTSKILRDIDGKHISNRLILLKWFLNVKILTIKNVWIPFSDVTVASWCQVGCLFGELFRVTTKKTEKCNTGALCRSPSMTYHDFIINYNDMILVASFMSESRFPIYITLS